MYNKNLGPYGDPKGEKGTSGPNGKEPLFNINLLSNIPRNKEMIIKLKLDDNGNLVYLHLESSEQQNDKKIKKRNNYGNFTDYEIECFIERWHPLHGTRIPMHHG